MCRRHSNDRDWTAFRILNRGGRYGRTSVLAAAWALPHHNNQAAALSAHATTLLPSQEEHDLVTVKTCRDHEVLSSLKAAIDRSLQASSVLARGMRGGDVHLEAVWIDQPAVICSTTVAANGIRERISIRLPWRDRPTSSNSAANPEEANYFRTNLRSGPSIWICHPPALDRLRPVRSDALIQPRRLATICSTDYHAPPPHTAKSPRG